VPGRVRGEKASCSGAQCVRKPERERRKTVPNCAKIARPYPSKDLIRMTGRKRGAFIGQGLSPESKDDRWPALVCSAAKKKRRVSEWTTK